MESSETVANCEGVSKGERGRQGRSEREGE